MSIGLFIVKRALALFPVIIGITLATFLLTRVVPGDPARVLVGEGASAEALAALREELGLNDPLIQQYVQYLGGLLQGDLGISARTAKPVAQELAERFPATAELAVAAMLITLVVGVPLGIMAALCKGTIIDDASRLLALVGVSIPIFWLGLLLIILFYLQLGVVPAPIGRFAEGIPPPPGPTGFLTIDALLHGDWRALSSALGHLALPAITLASWSTAIVMRITRSSILDVLNQDFVRTARAKGIRPNKVVSKHVLRNALLPMVTIAGLEFGNMLGGAVLTETVFNWPGMGLYAVNSIFSVDYAPVQGFTLLTAAVFVTVNAIVDMLYVVIDPRVQYA